MLRKIIRTLHARISQFLAARDGSAVVEFALILPLLLVLYAGSVEISELIAADRRANTISGTVGDLVSRANGTVTEAELADYITVADAIMRPFPTVGLQQVVTCVFIDAAGVTNVVWSRGFNGGTAHTANQPYAALAAGVSDMNAIARDRYVIVSETSYSYTPIFGFRINDTLGFHQDLTTISLYHENFHLTRFGDIITLI